MHEQAVTKGADSQAPQQQDEQDAGTKQAAEERSDSLAAGDAEHVAKEEDEWKPSVAKTETKLDGTFGAYTLKHGFHYDATDGWAYEADLTMEANDKAKADKIGWIQVVRRTKGAGKGWATGKDDQGMTEERAKRTDSKTGFRVDRASAPAKKTPFYGMNKGTDSKLSNGSNTKVGKHGGTNPWLWDRPGLYAQDELEFVSTATDMDTGTQYDGVRWGCKYDKDGKVATEITPSLVKAGDALAAGRDRAINKWNKDVAGGDIDKVPTQFDAAGTAAALAGYMKGFGTDEAGIHKTLKGITDPTHKKQLLASYKLETGNELSKDLTDEMTAEELKGLESWL